MFHKRLIKREINFKGIGVHSGKKIELKIIPSEKKSIIFHSVKGNCFIPHNVNFVKNFNSSSLVKDNCKIMTVEHLLSSLYILGINSAEIFTSDNEIPILDGSSKDFADSLLNNSEIVGEYKEFFIIKNEGKIERGDAYIEYFPSNSFIVDYTIEYEHPLIGKMNFRLELDENNFLKEVSSARTFGFLKDAEYLKKMGLAKGASFDNTLVFDEQKLLNPPLRFKDEMVRHKILDFLGDLSFLKKIVKGEFKIYKGGHKLHISLVKELLGIN